MTSELPAKNSKVKASANATLRDVARLAEASVATVSRVLASADYPVSAALRKKVLDAAVALDYVPNIMARHLKSTFSNDIGVVFPNLTNPFYIQTLQGVHRFTCEQNLQLVLCSSMRQVEKERQHLRTLYERRVRGVLLSSVDEYADMVTEYVKRGMNVVLLDQWLQDAPCSTIHFDSRKGAALAMRHLLAIGHREIAFATAPLTRWTRREIFNGYQEALEGYGLPFNEANVFISGDENEIDRDDYDLQAGQALAMDYLKRGSKATAVLCVNDMIALGFIKAISGTGINVPRDLSVIGFDDIPFASVFQPSLTTVRYPSYEAGRLAVMMLLDNLTPEKEHLPVRMRLDPTLIIRETVRPLNTP